MGSTTPIYLLPYPVGTDRVMDGDNAMQALAERVEAVLDPRINDTGGWVSIPAGSGYVSTAAYRKVGTYVQLRGGFTPSSGNFTVNSSVTVGTIPTGARPPAAKFYVCPCQAGGGPPMARLDVGSSGNLVVFVPTGTTTNQVWVDQAHYYTD